MTIGWTAIILNKFWKVCQICTGISSIVPANVRVFMDRHTRPRNNRIVSWMSSPDKKNNEHIRSFLCDMEIAAYNQNLVDNIFSGALCLCARMCASHFFTIFYSSFSLYYYCIYINWMHKCLECVLLFCNDSYFYEVVVFARSRLYSYIMAI